VTALRVAWPLAQIMLFGRSPFLEGALLGIVLSDGPMLLYLYKSKRVRAGYFPQAVPRAETMEDTPDDQTT
ncbi:MAG: hypothetical protein LBN04_04215, partial [Oscillospiraceae bacterium]|jgi:hypothetical protein|nr:hypothetical protein [Oscillospiraceae bacterium]